MELELNDQLTPFSLESTLSCGQLFRWEKKGAWWLGVVEDRVFRVQQASNILKFEGVDVNFIRDYFRLGDNLPQIIQSIGRDPLVRQAALTFPGLRIVRQDPWECLISFICATYKNIPAIKNMIFELTRRFGTRIVFDDRSFHTFPAPNVLARASLSELKKCKLGFRARRVQETAEIVSSRNDLRSLRTVDYEAAGNELLRLPGVGPKVADCVLLFSLEKLEAFPIDTWMRRVLIRHYANHLDSALISKVSKRPFLSQKDYRELGSFARDYFGENAGYAQEYLYHFVRSKHFKVSA